MKAIDLKHLKFLFSFVLMSLLALTTKADRFDNYVISGPDNVPLGTTSFYYLNFDYEDLDYPDGSGCKVENADITVEWELQGYSLDFCDGADCLPVSVGTNTYQHVISIVWDDNLFSLGDDLRLIAKMKVGSSCDVATREATYDITINLVTKPSIEVFYDCLSPHSVTIEADCPLGYPTCSVEYYYSDDKDAPAILDGAENGLISINGDNDLTYGPPLNSGRTFYARTVTTIGTRSEPYEIVLVDPTPPDVYINNLDNEYYKPDGEVVNIGLSPLGGNLTIDGPGGITSSTVFDVSALEPGVYTVS